MTGADAERPPVADETPLFESVEVTLLFCNVLIVLNSCFVCVIGQSANDDVFLSLPGC